MNANRPIDLPSSLNNFYTLTYPGFYSEAETRFKTLCLFSIFIDFGCRSNLVLCIIYVWLKWPTNMLLNSFFENELYFVFTHLKDSMPKMWLPSITCLIIAIIWGCDIVKGRICPGTHINPSWTTTGISTILSSSRRVLPLTSSMAPRYYKLWEN